MIFKLLRIEQSIFWLRLTSIFWVNIDLQVMDKRYVTVMSILDSKMINFVTSKWHHVLLWIALWISCFNFQSSFVSIGIGCLCSAISVVVDMNANHRSFDSVCHQPLHGCSYCLVVFEQTTKKRKKYKHLVHKNTDFNNN